MKLPGYEVLAQAFVAEGVDTVFTLMGDANMHWANAMTGHNGVKAIFGRPGFAAIAKGFGLRGANVSDLKDFKSLLRGYDSAAGAEVWNIPISDKVVSIMQARQSKH